MRDGISDPRVAGKMICVTDCSVDRDLTLAQVYVSVLGVEENKQQEVLDALNSAEGYIKSCLKTKIKLRAMPALRFFYDNSINYGMKISKLIDEVNSKQNG